MPDDRRAIHAYLTADGHDTWHRVAEESGVSLSGLLEALADDMAAHAPDNGGHARWGDIVKAARRIDAQRRRRSRG